MVSLLICSLSYSLCFRTIKGKTITMDSYLFTGNTPKAALASIVGSTFSTVLLLGTLPAIYFSYGFLMYFPSFIAAVCGFLVLRRSLQNFRQKAGVSEEDTEEPSFLAKRYLKFIRYRELPITFTIISLIYLILAFISEIGALNNGLQIIGHTDLWGDLTVYILAIIAIIYVYVGGFKGVLTTDILQIGFLIAALITCFYATSLSPEFDVSNIFNKALQTVYSHEPSRVIWGSIATFLVAITWLSSAPEMFMRLLSIKPQKVNWVISSSWVGFFFALLIPIFLILASNLPCSSEDGFGAAFSLWGEYLYNQRNPLVSLSFIFIIVSAAITTLDTILITTFQLLQCLRKRYDTVQDKFQEKHLRLFLSLFFYLLVLLGGSLPLGENILIGIFTYSMMIPLFIMQFISPRVFKGMKKPTNSYLIALLVIAPSIIYAMNHQFKIESANYHFIPIIIAIVHIVHLAIYFGIQKIRGVLKK